MFLDEAKINIKAGNGGNGSVTFFYLQKGGKKIACGGTGGKGGSIIIKATRNLSTLYGFKKKVHFKAENGQNGQSNNRNGRDGGNLVIMVPVGTIIKDTCGKIIADLDAHDKEALISAGGLGGRGNSSFVSQSRRFPAFAEKGEETEESWINLELRIIADVALVGFPNSGKSTIISRISAARPKIADYPFTTLTPNLGVVEVNDFNFAVADIPGLIEGAHNGTGLGDKFLRHITRTTLLVFILDGALLLEGFEKGSKEIIKTLNILREEIKLYDISVYEKEYFIVLNKIDLIPETDILGKMKVLLEGESGKEVFLISAITGKGLDDFLIFMSDKIKAIKSTQIRSSEISDFKEEKTDFKVYSLDDGKAAEDKLEIIKNGNEYIVKSKKLERLVSMTDLENEEALEYLKSRLQKMGIGDRLKKMGISEGSTVIIGNLVFLLAE